MGSALETVTVGAWPSSTAAIVTATAVATATLIAFGKASLWPRKAKVHDNPLKTLSPSALSSADTFKSLVYKPGQFPGERDVETPYGSTRVYEFGPEDGEKVLFIHGISTSCVTLCRIAEGLVENHGCRVMLFDLFGRGFSDGVGDLPYDERLYLSQILFVLASSPLAWTGKDARLRVIGYSLGGGIAVHLANHMPHLVESLVLLAPSGLIDARSFGAISRFLFSSGIVPERILAVLTRSRLQQPIAASKSPRHSLPAKLETIAKAEAADPPTGEPVTPLEHRVLMYVRWMVLNHVGFVPSFMSSIRHSPLTEQHDSWRRLSDRKPGSTAMIFAKSDEIIDLDDYNRQAPSLIGGKENVMWRELEGGHDFVMTHAQEILEVLDEFWYPSSSP